MDAILHICEVCWHIVDPECDDAVVRPVDTPEGKEFAFWHADHFPGDRQPAS